MFMVLRKAASMTRLTAAAAIMLIVALSLPGCGAPLVRVKGSVTVTAPHVAGTALIVESRNGSVAIVPEPGRSDVQVEAQITCAAETQSVAQQRLALTTIAVTRVEAAGSGAAGDATSTLSIKPIFPDGPRNGDGASLVIRVPDAVGVNVRTSNGPIQVNGTAGTLDLQSSNGNITVAQHQGPATIRTSNGRINVDGLGGSLAAHSSNGSIMAGNVAGRVKAASSNGAMDIALTEDQPGPVELRSSNGAVHLAVGPAFVGEVSVQTSNGSIRVEDPGQRITSRSMKKRSGKMMFGVGGEPSTIRTSNGRVTVTVK